MGNLLMKCGFKRLKRYEEMGIYHGNVTLLLVGLDNSGKTTAAKGILGEEINNVVPTVGFIPMDLTYRGCSITMFDLGGGARFRDLWTKYFAEIYGVIFVIDSSDPNRIEEGKKVLSQLLSNARIAGKPILILANKQDIDGALDEIDLVEALDIEQVVNEYRCPTRVEMCTAIQIHKKKPDKPIADGFRWLIDTIVLHYGSLEKRVMLDIDKEQKRFLLELEERKGRVKRNQLERERIENESLNHTKNILHSQDSEILFVHQDVSKKRVKNTIANSSTNHFVIDDKKSVILSQEEDSSSRSPHSPHSLEELKELGVTSSFSSDSSAGMSNGTISVMDSGSPQVIYVKSSSPHSDEKSVTENPVMPPNGIASSDGKIVRQDTTEINVVPSDFSNSSQDKNICEDAGSSEPEIISTLAHNNGSVISHVVEHLELEVTRSNRKRKPILKRLNKTAPSATIIKE